MLKPSYLINNEYLYKKNLTKIIRIGEVTTLYKDLRQKTVKK